MRNHSEDQVAQIAASIREWGWTTPVLVDEAGGIIAGHGRVLAARKLRLTEVPVMVAAGWTEAQKRAYVIADNKLTLNGGFTSDIERIVRVTQEALTADRRSSTLAGAGQRQAVASGRRRIRRSLPSRSSRGSRSR
jgi:ParB-like chromosome segregation protein Spo0J